MKVILSGGGTGGHVNPALAIGEAIEKYDPTVELHYVGTPAGIENKLVPEKYTMHHIEIRGLKRSLSPSNIKTAAMTVKAFKNARKLLSEVKPDAVIGTGGYVCWPICAAAAKEGIPCFLHESNAVPGFAVKMLEKKADVIFLNFAKTAEQLKKAKKTMHVGTPLKSAFYTETAKSARNKLSIDEKYEKIVLSFGGSLGAATLNREILSLMKDYGRSHPDTLFLHATGARGYKEFDEAFSKEIGKCPDNLKYSEYIYDMPIYMAAADLIICRSGAMTLSEIAALRKPSILIPSPNVTNDQQTKNARLLSENNAAILLREEDLSDGKLTSTVTELLSDNRRIDEMKNNVGKFAASDPEKAITDEIVRVIKEKKERT